MKRLLAIMLMLVTVLASLTGCITSPSGIDESVDGESVNGESVDNSEEISVSVDEEKIRILQYTWDDWGISYKTIEDCDTLYNIIDYLKNAKETGKTTEKISDDVLELGGGEYPVERGTMWIEWGNKIYRLSHDRSLLCLVDTHFGKGKALEITEEFITDVNNAWYYVPFNYYIGTYNKSDDSFEYKHIFESPSSVKLSIKDIDISSEHDFHDGAENRITVELISDIDQEVQIDLDCRQSEDNLGLGDFKTVQLKKDVPVTVELSFIGWSDFCYWIYIQVDYTMARIEINP